MRRLGRYLDRFIYKWLNRINGFSILCVFNDEGLPPSQHGANRQVVLSTLRTELGI